MGDAEDSPFASLGSSSLKEEAPAPPAPVSARDVVGLLDSPFASGMIGPQLVQQLSQSLAAGSTGPQQQQQPSEASSQAARQQDGAGGAQAPQQQPAAEQQPQGGGDDDNRPLRGVASILESPFSSCLSVELKQLEVDQPLEKLPDASA